MTNQEVFEQYGTEKWVVEQNLCFLLQTYWDEHCRQFGSQMPYNPVSFVKSFMKEETLCSVEYAEKSKMETLNNNAVVIEDVDYRVVEEP